MEEYAKKRIEEGADDGTLIRELLSIGVAEQDVREFFQNLRKKRSQRFLDELPLPLWVYGVIASTCLLPVPFLLLQGTASMAIGLFLLGFSSQFLSRLWIMGLAFSEGLFWGMAVLLAGEVFVPIFCTFQAIDGKRGKTIPPGLMYTFG